MHIQTVNLNGQPYTFVPSAFQVTNEDPSISNDGLSILGSTVTGDGHFNYTFDESGGITSITLKHNIISQTPAGTIYDVRIFGVVYGDCRDTDGDGIPDYLDLDSDGDGCPDAREGAGNFNPSTAASGTLSTQTPNINFGTTVDANGVPTAVGASGQAVGQSSDFTKNDCLDSDGDGYPDWQDLDDDNDGILDTDECTATSNQLIAYTNNSNYNAGATTSPLSGAPSVAGSGITRSLQPTNFYQIISGVDALTENQAIANNEYVEYTITPSKNMVIDRVGYYSTNFATTNEDTQYNYTLRVSVDNFTSNYLLHGEKNYQADQGDLVFPTNNMYFLEPNITYKFRVYFYAVNGGATATIAHDDFKLFGYVECDTDNDGIPNRLDLDSDGDTCPDAIEGAGTFTTSQLTTASGTLSAQSPNQNFGVTVDANGVPTIVGASGQAVGNSQNEMLNDCIEFVCLPDPYAAQQTWWLPYRWSTPVGGSAVMIDFQSGSAVLNNPVAGTFGQGNITSYEGNTAVTNPITGALIFVTDGNKVFRGSDGLQATGLVGGNDSAGEAAGVIPDQSGVLGRDFIIFGNGASNTAGPLRSAKYNAETNVLSGITTLLSGSAIYEALEVIPHTNGVDYWILVNTADQKVKSYLYTKAAGFNATPVSSTDVPDLAGVDAGTISVNSFITWDPRTPGKVLIARHNKVGLANFDPSTGALGNWDVKVAVTSGTLQDNARTGYSAAMSPNGRYIYYNEVISPPTNTGTLKYYDLQTGTTTTLDTYTASGNGMKIAPDGRLYKYGYISGVPRLLYLNADANTPPTTPGSLLPFDTGGRQTALQFPNNVYWGCIVCEAGTNAPTLANTNITSNPATVGDLIALLSASNQPAGTVITIHTDVTATDANKLTNTTVIVPGTTYYAAFYDGLAVCYSPTTAVFVGSCINNPVTGIPDSYTLTGISNLAGFANGWPGNVPNGFLAIESKNKGFVITRVANTSAIVTPVEGMLIYDLSANCVKLYNGTSWKCLEKDCTGN